MDAQNADKREQGVVLDRFFDLGRRTCSDASDRLNLKHRGIRAEWPLRAGLGRSSGRRTTYRMTVLG